MHGDMSERIQRCKTLAQETAIGLLTCKVANNEFGARLLMREYSLDATALGVPAKRAQSLLTTSISATAISAFTQLAASKGCSVEQILQAESLKVSTWAANRAH